MFRATHGHLISKTVNKRGGNYDENMDWGAMTFTSDVSLPKGSK